MSAKAAASTAQRRSSSRRARKYVGTAASEKTSALIHFAIAYAVVASPAANDGASVSGYSGGGAGEGAPPIPRGERGCGRERIQRRVAGRGRTPNRQVTRRGDVARQVPVDELVREDPRAADPLSARRSNERGRADQRDEGDDAPAHGRKPPQSRRNRPSSGRAVVGRDLRQMGRQRLRAHVRPQVNSTAPAVQMPRTDGLVA